MDKDNLCVQRIHKNMRLPKYLIDLANEDIEFPTFTAEVESLLYNKYKDKIKVTKIPTDYSNVDIDDIPLNTKTRVVYGKD